ncbi:MAG TPA: HD domain-containing protein [Vitreimonas sp.]|nr:HD domain-containing protein [Vitreimonas sp.]
MTHTPTLPNPNDLNLNRDLEFLYEIGCLRHIQRTWRQFLNPDFQNLSEHMLRVVWISLVLAKYEGVTNTEKIMKMAIIHDLSESRSVDSHYVSRQYVERFEEEALEDTLEGTAVRDEFMAIWKEYEERECIEAKIVKDADTLDVDMELKEQEYRGLRLGEDTLAGRMYVAQEKLYTDTARELFYMIQESNPNDWHLKGKNRFTSGDWRKAKPEKKSAA